MSLTKIISKTYLENCDDFICRMTDKFADWAICDIPYGIGVGKMPFLKEMNTMVKQKNGTYLNGNKNKKPYTHKEWDSITPDQKYFNELRRVSKNQIIFGVEYVNWQGLGNGRIKWIKGIPDGMSFKKYEIAYCSSIDYTFELPLLWAGMMQAKSLDEPMIQQGNKKLNEKRIHPCHKPILLYKKLLDLFCKQGDIIIDTHLGSGSIRIACFEKGLDFYACEIDEEYYNLEENRFKEYKLQKFKL
jgi:site-specific DNA-methyltransferase (adenine-specific)